MGLLVVLVSFILSARELLYLYNFLQDRLTVSPEAYPSIAIAVSKIYKVGVIGAFYAGISPTLIGMLPYSTCYYFMYETLKRSYCLAKKKKNLSRADMLLVGALSGANLALFVVVRIRNKIGLMSPDLIIKIFAFFGPGAFFCFLNFQYTLQFISIKLME